MRTGLANVLEPQDLAVTGQMLFLDRPREKPFVRFTYDHGESETNVTYVPTAVRLADARPLSPRLDVHGFQLLQQPSKIAYRPDEGSLQSAGRAEAGELVRALTGAQRVHVFDHTVRRAAPGALRQPSTRVHNDYTAASAVNRVRDLLGTEAEALLARPFAFVNVWRPLRHPAVDWPLGLCDARSVATEDLIATDIIYPDRRGEIYGAMWSPRQRWVYVPDMTPDEALLIKCYDTRPGVASFTPHTSFRNPLAAPEAPPRESVEFRTIAFFG